MKNDGDQDLISIRIGKQALKRACYYENAEPVNITTNICSGKSVFIGSKRSCESQNFRPILVGDDVRHKVAALVGMSCDHGDVDSYVKSLTPVLTAKPDLIMDLSTCFKANKVRHLLKTNSNVPIGCGLTYDIFRDISKPLSANQILETIERAFAVGVDLALIHLGVTQKLAKLSRASKRIFPTSSRGCGLIMAYMDRFGVENPLIPIFGDILNLFKKYGVVLDLGDAFRPSCTEDSIDDLKLIEVNMLNDYRKIAIASGVQVICESGGHIPLNLIHEIISTHKSAVNGAPLWVAGPIPLDIAVCYDSIANAIGVVSAAQSGGNLFCSITDREHYTMPKPEDTARSIQTVRVALACVELAKRNPSELYRNHEFSKARASNDWEKQISFALDPMITNLEFSAHNRLNRGMPCSICGPFCPHILSKRSPGTLNHQ